MHQNKNNRTLFVLSVILLFVSGCGKSHNQPFKNENPDLQKACWITDGRVWPVADSLMYGDFPAPLFRKEFSVKKNIKSATLYVTAAGYYSASINGKPIGENYLDPAWTNYSKRIYYSELNITSDIKTGTNCIGTTLGNGFYNLRIWGSRNLRDELLLFYNDIELVKELYELDLKWMKKAARLHPSDIVDKGLSDDVYSNCHPMFGSVSEWFYSWLGGIRPDPDYPGFERFIIAPSLPDGLEYVKCSYHSPFGEIVSNWDKKGINHQVFEIKIPEGSAASVMLPVKEQQVINIKEKMSNSSYSPVRGGKNNNEFELRPGEYVISVIPAQ